MPGIITALRLHRRNRQRVEVYLDDQRAFTLTLVEAAHLRRGQSLSDEEIVALQARDAQERAHEDALRYLSYRARSAVEIERYLAGRQIPPAVIEAEVQRLQESGLLDDAAFARAWVNEREEFRPRSPRALRQELRQKGLDEETITQAITGIDPETSAYEAARGRAARLGGLDYWQFRHRLGAFLARRGFDYDIVRTVVDRLWREERGASPPQDDALNEPTSLL
ncbi:MAG: RecX family transcriptional regulator [Anaerolineae bacterium]|nr:RecX family transcriptional regulator [Anaerolineae bacterium]